MAGDPAEDVYLDSGIGEPGQHSGVPDPTPAVRTALPGAPAALFVGSPVTSDGLARGAARQSGRLGDLLFGGIDQSQDGIRRGRGVAGLDGLHHRAVTRQ